MSQPQEHPGPSKETKVQLNTESLNDHDSDDSSTVSSSDMDELKTFNLSNDSPHAIDEHACRLCGIIKWQVNQAP